jgi:hypothetical protein
LLKEGLKGVANMWVAKLADSSGLLLYSPVRITDNVQRWLGQVFSGMNKSLTLDGFFFIFFFQLYFFKKNVNTNSKKIQSFTI